jgi:hypothetical protein
MTGGREGTDDRYDGRKRGDMMIVMTGGREGT